MNILPLDVDSGLLLAEDVEVDHLIRVPLDEVGAVDGITCRFSAEIHVS